MRSDVTRAADPLAAVTLTCLSIQASVQQPGRDVGRRVCGRSAVELQTNCNRIVDVTSA